MFLISPRAATSPHSVTARCMAPPPLPPFVRLSRRLEPCGLLGLRSFSSCRRQASNLPLPNVLKSEPHLRISPSSASQLSGFSLYSSCTFGLRFWSFSCQPSVPLLSWPCSSASWDCHISLGSHCISAITVKRLHFLHKNPHVGSSDPSEREMSVKEHQSPTCFRGVKAE